MCTCFVRFLQFERCRLAKALSLWMSGLYLVTILNQFLHVNFFSTDLFVKITTMQCFTYFFGNPLSMVVDIRLYYIAVNSCIKLVILHATD